MNYSNQQLKTIALTNPKEFLNIINYGADVATISAVIDLCDELVVDESVILPLLQKCLKHLHASIRENALYCANSFYFHKQTPISIVDRIKYIKSNDPSPDLRDVAETILKDIF
jgi:hypothetical protein